MGLRPSFYPVLYRLIPLFYYLIRFYLSLLRVRVVGEEIALGCLADYGRLIAAVWHQRFLPALAYVTKFRNFEPIVMISQSRDGELATKLAERLGLLPVRGSSTKGGTTALAAILKTLNKSPVVIHIVDGPTGPKGIVKPGLISMAQVSGAVILPVIVSATKAWTLPSWDRFLIPKPFSKVTIEWGQPMVVPRDLDHARHEELRREIEKRLSEGYTEADLGSGWKQPL
ncbi:lysophospholipid acyltransferase family protein [Thermodesulfobacteriota bacterium]